MKRFTSLTAAAAVLAVLLLSGAGCERKTVQSVCALEIPRVKLEVAEAIQELNQRQLASLQRKSSRDWPDWAERRILTLQSTFDSTQGEIPSSVRKNASRLITQLMAFHGFAVEGNRKQMSLSLVRADQDLAKLQQQVCGASR